MLYQCFPTAFSQFGWNPCKHKAPAQTEDDPKRITFRSSLILAKTRGFAVNKGPPSDSSGMCKK